MPGFFDALHNFKPKETKKPTVTVEGKTFEVDIDLFKQVEKYGIEQYEIKNNKLVRKPNLGSTKFYEILIKSEKGYKFVDADPFWPDKIVKGGYTWQIESE